ncbi:MAG: ABC transporter permease [Vicinamibacterales bacterium]
MTPSWDARREIRRRAGEAGVDLPDSIVEELVVHLDDVYEAAIEDGCTHEEALARAHVALDESRLAQLRRHADRRPDTERRLAADADAERAATGSWHVWRALVVALRQFRQAPTFAAVTVLVLGLGTGAATTVFTVVDAVVLRPLPYRAPNRLVTLWDTNPGKALTHDPISPVNFMDYRALPVFADGAAWWRPALTVADPGQEPLRLNAIEVSNNLFALLGIEPQLGPGFPPSDLLHSNDLIAVISDRLWRTRYGADPGIVGRSLVFNSTPYRIAGVMPPGFHYPDDVDVWQRLRWDLTEHSRAAHFMEAVLRLSDGTTIEEAGRAVDTLAQRLQTEFRETNSGWGARLVPLLDEQLGYYRPALVVALGAVVLLLLIATLNVASLLLARAMARSREMAVRLALGASTRHLVVQLMAESAVLSFAGALVGAAVAWAALPLAVAIVPVSIPRLDGAAVDVRALFVCLGVAVLATLAFGLAPAIPALRTSPAHDLKAAERGNSKGGRRAYAALVIAEVAVASALLACSALLVRSVVQMVRTPTGVDADGVLTMQVQFTRDGIGTDRDAPQGEAWTRVAGTYARLLDAVRSQPGVTAAGAANFLPLSVGWRNPFAVEGQPRASRFEDLPQAQMHSMSDGYVEAMGIRLAAGRPFTPRDDANAPPVVLVNESFARQYFTGGPATGQRLRMWASAIGPLGFNLQFSPERQHEGLVYEVVGVVADVKNSPLGQPVEPAVFLPAAQFPFSELFLAVRASDTAAARSAIRAALQQVAPGVPMALTRTWGERFAATSAEARLLTWVLASFGGLAALLAALGVYGLVSWSVATQTRELAIRLTLGAAPVRVGRTVLVQAAWLVAGGALAGLAIVRLAETLLARVLYGVSATDATALAAATAVLLVAGLGACLPAVIRAMRVDPAIGLRTE